MQIAMGANYYWVGGSGNWKDYANHWATASGGSVFHIRAPTLVDNVYFDVNSFTAPGQTVTIDTSTAYCWDMDWTGVTNNPTFNAANTSVQLKAYGSLTLNSTMDFAFNGSLLFSAVSAGKTIATFGKTLPLNIIFNGPGGEWSLQDSLIISGDIILTYGTLITNNYKLRFKTLQSNNNNARALYLGTSTVILTGGNSYDWDVNSSLILDAESAIITLIDLRGGIQDGRTSFYSGGHNYNIIEWRGNYSCSSGCNPYPNYMYSDSSKINKLLHLTIGGWLYVSSDSSQIDTIISNDHVNISGSGTNVQYIQASNTIYTRGDLDITIIESGGYVSISDGSTISSVTAGTHLLTSGNNNTIGIMNVATDVATGGTNTIDVMTVGGNATLGGTNTFGTMNVSGNATFTGINHIGNTIVYGNFTISQNSQTLDTCQIYGNGNFLSDNNHFGMLTIKPGKTYTFGAGKTQIIDSLIVEIDPTLPIQLISSDVGIPANVVINSPLCADYLFIQAVHASGSNAFYVGANSVNIANNAGWIFAACAPVITYSISGAIITETGIPVPGVTVTLSGDDIQTATTGTNGFYTFTGVQGGSYTVTPSKNNDVVTNNGITSIDILLTRRHILGTSFSTPYKIMAADVDGSNSVSTLDILLMRSMILQSIPTFPNGRLWSFVPSDYVFADQLNPFPFPISRSYSNLSGSLANQDFIGIKLGDVNNSWDANIQ